jgi:hypothetical protein
MNYELTLFLLGTALGTLIGGISAMVYFSHLVVVMTKVLAGTVKLPNTTEQEGKVARITEKIKKAIALGKEQLDLFGKLDGPNKGAAHSKWKNELGARIRDLETQKIALYQEIVAEGFDPLITMIDANGEPQQVKMSDVCKSYAVKNPDATPAPKPTSTLAPTVKIDSEAKVLKFVKKDPKLDK